MSIHTYKCEECGHEFDMDRSFNEDNLGEYKCPKCGKIAKKIWKVVNYKTNANGFYGRNS